MEEPNETPPPVDPVTPVTPVSDSTTGTEENKTMNIFLGILIGVGINIALLIGFGLAFLVVLMLFSGMKEIPPSVRYVAIGVILCAFLVAVGGAFWMVKHLCKNSTTMANACRITLGIGVVVNLGALSPCWLGSMG
jgi:uncharacterized membrane protein YqjE